MNIAVCSDHMVRILILSLLVLSPLSQARGDELENRVEEVPTPAATPTETNDPLEIGFSRCQTVDYTLEAVDLPEASGAAYFEEEGLGYALVVSDSGGSGEAVVLSLDAGTVQGTFLPLGVISGDDIEGLATVDYETFLGITSSGYLRQWTRSGFEFSLVEDAYAISDERGFTCRRSNETNCEKNYEGICLHPEPESNRTGCVGYALSKTLGNIYCLTVDDTGHYSLDPDRAHSVLGAERLTGCSFGLEAPFPMLVGTNGFDLGRIRRITGLEESHPSPSIELVDGALGPGFAEALVAIPGGLLSFSDNGARPSRMRRFTCE